MANGFDDSGLRKKFNKLLGVESTIMKQVHKVFVDNTPIDKGRAKRNTKLKDNVVEADYPYAFVLDAGRKKVGKKMQGSTQAPQGMTKPTKVEMVKIAKNEIKKAGK